MVLSVKVPFIRRIKVEDGQSWPRYGKRNWRSAEALPCKKTTDIRRNGSKTKTPTELLTVKTELQCNSC